MTVFDKELNESSVKDALELITNMCKDGQETESKEVDERLSEGKREHHRNPFFIVVDYATQGHAYRDFIQNISPGGVFIETPMPFTVGQELSLVFAPPDYQKHIKITGEVVRISPQGIGVKFKMAKHHQETANRKELGERRKDKRFQLQVDIFALLNRPFWQTAEIIDISMGGLSFRYIGWTPKGSFMLDILCVDDDFYLGNVPFKIVTELKISKEIRRHGVQFGWLTNKQSSQLKFLIQTHTAAEV